MWVYYGMNVRVQIPDQLAERVERLADQKGYNGVTDFVRESVRLRADELENKNNITEE